LCGLGQPINLIRVRDRVVDHRAVALHKFQLKAHALQQGQDVGEDDGGIEGEGVDRLQGDLGGDRRVLDHAQHAGEAFLHRAVFRHVAAGLAHEPHRGVGHGLTGAGGEKRAR
jgi:hypothetical protein